MCMEPQEKNLNDFIVLCIAASPLVMPYKDQQIKLNRANLTASNSIVNKV